MTGPLTSVTFWLSLVAAATMYGAAALAPVWHSRLILEQQHFVEQTRLVALEAEDMRIQRLIRSLQDDPLFAAELARENFHTEPDENRIPVEGALAHAVSPQAPVLNIPPPQLPGYFPLLEIVAENHRVSSALLLTAAGLIVYAFTFLHPGDRFPVKEQTP